MSKTPTTRYDVAGYREAAIESAKELGDIARAKGMARF
jgi:hypothetical protein